MKDDSGAYAIFAEQGIVSFANDSIKGDGRHCEITRLCRTSRRRNISLHPSQNGGRSKVAQNSKVRVSIYIYGYVFHTTNGQNHGQASKTQWFLLNETCMDTHLLATWEKHDSRKFCWNLDGKKYRIGNVCLFIEK